MQILCKSCGTSYEEKYKVCPTCGTVPFSMPVYSKILAIVAGVFLCVTVIMLPFGVFDFGNKPRNNVSIVSPSLEPEPTPSATVTPNSESTFHPVESEAPDDSNSYPTESPTVTAKDADLTELSIRVWSDMRGKGHFYEGAEGFVLDLSKHTTLTLYAEIFGSDDSNAVEWISSNEGAFKITSDGKDSNGVHVAKFEAFKTCSNEKITIKYGSGYVHSFDIIIVNKPEPTQQNDTQTTTTP